MVEATLIPTALFYTAWMTIGPLAAYLTALVWGYGALARRLRSGHRVPGILILALVGLTVRTALALATGSTFVYFAQPILTTCLVAMLFLGSAFTGRPFIARLAGDFYPMTAEVAERHRIRRLFHQLTVMWAGVHLMNAAAATGLLMTMPTGAFIPTKTVVALVITAAGVTATVVSALRVMRHEGLVGASVAPVAVAAAGA